MRRRLPILLLGAGLLGCRGDELGPRVPAEVTVTPAAPQVHVGGTLQLTAAVLDATGQELAGEAVTFQSSDPAILTVDDGGLLTSVGGTGSSTITAASGGISAEVVAEAVLPPSAIVVQPRSLDLDTGEQVTLAFTVTDEAVRPVSGTGTAFGSSNPSVVRVEAPGGSDASVLVTGLDVGTGAVTLTRGSLMAEVPVTVAQHATSAVITPSSIVFPSTTGT